ncbi:interferon-induced very large GTPase 1-like [Hydra vulgaris]|uniref:Interferon-induced very large GTPase 1-like n=1 Tax=Hydra vulgaris TaxID=6087 RepID=A0ABM4B3C9_HYDVU
MVTLQFYTKTVAQDLLEKREGQDVSNVEFNEEECESEFKKFWNDVIDKMQKQEKKKCLSVDVRNVFRQELYNSYGQSAKFNSTIKRFGDMLENKFKIEWIYLLEHLQWNKSFLSLFKVICFNIKSFIQSNEKDLRCEVENMISSAVHRIQTTLLSLVDIGDVIQMKFQTYPQFDCIVLVQQYLRKAVDILKITHSEVKSSEKFNLNNSFIAVFACYAAQIAVENFSKVQESYLAHVDTMEKIKKEKKSFKELFLSILRKEKDITIAARQIRSLLLTAAKKQALVSIRGVLKELVLNRITQKLHVHGLVLRDVIEVVSKNPTSDEEISFLKTYFNEPFVSFKDKISQVIDDNEESNISKEFNLKLNAIIEKLKTECLNKFEPDRNKTLKVNICEYSVIKTLGIGEVDFDNIFTPNFEKRMEDEKELIEKLASLFESADNNEVKLSFKEELNLKEQLKNDIKNHLFQCTTKCPFCRAPCNQTHADESNDHSSRCHRPQGFGHWIVEHSTVFVIEFCNDLVISSRLFKNIDTKYEYVRYEDYKSVGPNYLSWEIDVMASDHCLYWKYITYHVMQNLDKFYPEAVKTDISNWSGVTKIEAINVINNCFYLDGATVRNVNGRHIV